MDEEPGASDPFHEDDVIFVAEGVVAERLGVPIDVAIVALADMAVTRETSLLDTARAIVDGLIAPGSSTASRPAEQQMADPDGG